MGKKRLFGASIRLAKRTIALSFFNINTLKPCKGPPHTIEVACKSSNRNGSRMDGNSGLDAIKIARATLTYTRTRTQIHTQNPLAHFDATPIERELSMRERAASEAGLMGSRRARRE